MSTLEQVATILDVAVKYEEGFSESDLTSVSDLLENTQVRDELLGVAMSDGERAGALIGNLCQTMAESLPAERIAPPATLASIIAYTWGEGDASAEFLSLALWADKDYRLADLFSQMVKISVPPDVVKNLIGVALSE
jgi:hypothetical protein